MHEFAFDFRIGGSEVSRFSFQDGPEIRLDAHSASVTTVELVPSGNGTLVIYTEQGAFFDSADSAQGREEGCRGLLDSLAVALQKAD